MDMKSKNTILWRSLTTLPLLIPVVTALLSHSPKPAIADPPLSTHQVTSNSLSQISNTTTNTQRLNQATLPNQEFTSIGRALTKNSVIHNLIAALPVVPPIQPSSIVAQLQFRTMTASKQGGYYRAAQELNRLINANQIQLMIEESVGSQQNLQAIANGTTDLAFIQMDAAALQEKYDLESGTDLLGQIRIFAPTTSETIHIVVNKNSNIDHLRDLSDKLVSFGPRASGSAVSAAYIYFSLGLDPDQVGQNITFASVAESIQMVNRGDLDAAFFTAAQGVPVLANLSASESKNLDLLSIDDFTPFVNSGSGFSLYAPVYLPAYNYSWQEREVAALSVFSFMIVSAKLDTDQVYALAKAVYANADRLKQQNSFWQFLSVAQARLDISQQAPYHPGVIKYINEVSRSVPQN
jgi:TRAP transporter TAXI family solute receptor